MKKLLVLVAVSMMSVSAFAERLNCWTHYTDSNGNEIKSSTKFFVDSSRVDTIVAGNNVKCYKNSSGSGKPDVVVKSRNPGSAKPFKLQARGIKPNL
jgi:hypothetical protein